MNDDEKMRAELKETIDDIAPDQNQRDRIWNHIEEKIDGKADRADLSTDTSTDMSTSTSADTNTKKYTKRRSVMWKRLTAIAAAFVLVATGITVHNGNISGTDVPNATGYVYAAEARVTDLTPREILVFTGDPASNNGGNEVYAPAIYYLDKSMLVFGNGYGLVIYDRVNGKVEGLIDLQAICSSYYNCDTVKTHITVKDSKLTVYNTKGDYTDYGMPDEESGRDMTETAWGYYHIYDLSDLPGKADFIKCAESGEFDNIDCDMYRDGKAFEEEHYLDAWDNVAYLQTPLVDEAVGSNGGTYSEKAFVYTDSEGAEQKCVLLCMSNEDVAYTLVEENAKTGKTAEWELQTGITSSVRKEVNESCSLPAYEYKGDDPVMKAICEDMANGEEVGEGEVLIPEPNIYGKAEEGDELLVFGDFFRDSYVKRGNTLVCVSGGSYPGCYHLKRSESGDGSYVVSSIDMAEDGDGYTESINKFTEGYPEIRSRFMASAGFDEAVRKDCIKAYAEASGAGIEYYKDYGWDPIKL